MPAQISSRFIVHSLQSKIHSILRILQKFTVNRKPRTPNQLGFTLVELVIVLFLVTVSIFIFLKSTDTLGRIGRSRNQTKAYHLSAKKIEELRNTPFENLPPSGPFVDDGLSGQLTVQDFEGHSDIKQVTVEIFFLDQSIQKKAQLDTLMSKFGFNP